MDPQSVLTTTINHLDDAGVPEELRPVAFVKVFDLVAGASGRTSTTKDGAPAGGEIGDELEKIAHKLGVDAGLVERVYAFENGELELVAPAKNLKTAKSQAAAQIALVVTAGRQAAGLDDGWTDVDEVRTWCENYKKYDSANFATHMKAVGDDVMRVRGGSRDRKLGMTNPAWTRAAEVVESLATGQ